MKRLILLSNYRVRVALAWIKLSGRTDETLAEVKAALAQRAKMRSEARFVFWMLGKEHALRQRFDCILARCHLRTLAAQKVAFREFCLTEYSKN